MKRTHIDPELMLQKAVEAIRNSSPDGQAMQAATERVWQRVAQEAGPAAATAPLNRIEGCADVLRLLPDYQAGRLAPARALLVEDHLRECAACRVQAEAKKTSGSLLPWRADSLVRPRHWALGHYALAAAVVIAAFLGIAIGRNGWLLTPAGERASVQSVNGELFRVDANGEHAAKIGDQFGEGELVRTAGGSRAVLRLRDGSLVEMNGRSELAVYVTRRNTTLHLDRGMVIVQAAKRTSGHLYVDTPDSRVAVTGTIFSVNSGIKGSRVSVIEGTVHVAQAAGDSVLHAGDQVTSTQSMERVPVKDEISWSQDREKYLALLAEFSKFQKNLEQVKLPDLRYQSRLLPVVPDSTLFYAGVPNYGEALAQANQLFQQQLVQSPVLQEWYKKGLGRSQNGADFNEAIETIHSLSQYLGNEIVVAGLGGPYSNSGGVLVVAEIARPGLKEFLNNEINKDGEYKNLHVLSPEELGRAVAGKHEFNVLVAPDFVAASPEISVLRAAYQRWQQSSATSSFVNSDFGKRISSIYSAGAGLFLAVNLGQIEADDAQKSNDMHGREFLARSGFGDARYLIAERQDAGGKTSNTAEISFNGPRQGIASWLAAPAPIGALDFITPNAAALGAFVSKSPAAMFDDLMQIVSADNANAAADLAREQAELNIDIRDDLAASLGGDAALALDGPLLPTPSWKLIVEINDPNRLEYSLERLLESVNREAQQHGRPQATLEKQQVDGRTFYTVHALDPNALVELHYTFADGYLIAGPSQALVQEAIRTRESGNSISRSDKFRALLPTDEHANVSGLVYQDLAPVLGPIANQISAKELQSLQTIVANSEPMLVCAYGGENQIEVASNSKTLGFDLKAFTIGTLLGDLRSGTAKPVVP